MTIKPLSTQGLKPSRVQGFLHPCARLPARFLSYLSQLLNFLTSQLRRYPFFSPAPVFPCSRALLFLLSLAPLLLCSPSAVLAQVSWGPDVRLTFAPGWKYWPIVEVSGDTVYAVWEDQRRSGLEGEIFFRQSLNGGLTWESEIRLDTITTSRAPRISVRGPMVHVAWYDYRNAPDVEIRYVRSTDAGMSWTPDTAVLARWGWNFNPALAIGGGQEVFLTYVQQDSPTSRVGVWFRKSTNEGVTWQRDTLILPRIYYQGPRPLSYGQGVLHLVREGGGPGIYGMEILYRRSTDRGASWVPDVPLSPLDSITSQWPRVTASKDSAVHVVWMDGKYSQYPWTGDIFYRRSTDRGYTWEAIRETLTTLHRALSSDIAVDSGKVHVVWDDERSGKWVLYYRESTDNGLTWLPELLLTNGSQNSNAPSIATANGKVHVVWGDNRDDTLKSEVYYKRGVIITGVEGKGLGKPGFSGDLTLEISPNPFRKEVFIKCFLPLHLTLRLTLYNILGQEIKILADQEAVQGVFSARWDGRDAKGKDVPGGIYFVRLESEGRSLVQRIVKVR